MNRDFGHRTILVVEDSPEDYMVIRRAFQKLNMQNYLRRCENGDKALDYLYRRGEFADPNASPRPGIILLDLNLPGTDGREVLDEIKSDAQLKHIPVIVLTTSCRDSDIDSCYSAGANSYICKPNDLNGLMAAIQRLKDYWLDTAAIPKGGPVYDK